MLKVRHITSRLNTYVYLCWEPECISQWLTAVEQLSPSLTFRLEADSPALLVSLNQ